MGKKPTEKLIKAFKPYQVNKKIMSVAKKNATFMHCLPATRGNEVTEDVIDNLNCSLVWSEAENRLHIQKAILEWCLKKYEKFVYTSNNIINFIIFMLKKEVANERTKVEMHKPILLDVYDYKVIVKDEGIVIPNYLGFDANFLIQELTDWGNNKFKVEGLENSLSLIIQNFFLEKKNIKKYKGLKKKYFFLKKKLNTI